MSREVLASARRRLAELSRRALGSDPASAELDADELARHAEDLAAELFELSRLRAQRHERARERRLASMLDDARGQLFGILLTDRVARDRSFEHSADQLGHLRDLLGLPRFASPLERLQMEAAIVLGRVAPRLVGRLIAAQIRGEVEGLVFPFEPRALERYLRERQRGGVQVNLNFLGEAVLGEDHAQRRARQYVELLRQPEVSAISVKLSSIYSQISLCSWESTVTKLCERLRPIYEAARDAPDGPRLVYLDMEAYADLRLTLDVMRRLLDEPALSSLSAGVVLQAYVPESAALQRELSAWAIERVRRGGAPIRLRVVKGANLAAERVQSAHAGWQLPLFDGKPAVDASYAKMLDFGTRPEVAAAVRLGVASHNVFDVALGLVLRAARGVADQVGFEVLEGMANPMQRALLELGAPVLVYTPVVSPEELESAVAYLVRRLDENTAEENYLRHAFSMRLHDEIYAAQARAFRAALYGRHDVRESPKRAPSRYAEVGDLDASAPFANEPDTDFSSAANRSAIAAALGDMQSKPAFEVCSRIDGQALSSGAVEDAFDPSRPGTVPYRYRLAAHRDVQRAVDGARRALPAWQHASGEERRRLVREIARVLRRRRAELSAAMLMDTAKRVVEADAEVSEAVDFAEYYLRALAEQERESGVDAEPLGVVVVASPWNFPLAIPLSGVLAALLAGNVVIFKPAPESIYVGALLAECAWQAGVPERVLQLVICRDEDASPLVESPDVSALILTGATSTARALLERRPSLELLAETGGKNALIVTARADRERAVADLVGSAFGHSGQKCSAASLAILEAAVYDDPDFRRQLADAAASLVVGSAWDLSTRVTPLIREPGPDLARGLRTLDAGESWLLRPQPDADNPRLWSPGIRWDVSAGSFCHQTELFGPVLSVLRARDLQHALHLANATHYGLVAGLHSLDEREQQRFLAGAHAGNLYVNRSITGAMVGRQPFGGRKASSVGPGAKAGGPNYVVQLQRLRDSASACADEAAPLLPATAATRDPAVHRLVEVSRAFLGESALGRLGRGVAAYERVLDDSFRGGVDRFQLPGQDNAFRYQACHRVLIVANQGSDGCDLLLSCVAGLLAGVELQVSQPEAGGALAREALLVVGDAAGFPVVFESTTALEGRLAGLAPERVRWLGEAAPDRVLRAAVALGAHVGSRPVVSRGRHELLFYHREQSISVDYHRHGHLGLRSSGIHLDRPAVAIPSFAPNAAVSPITFPV